MKKYTLLIITILLSCNLFSQTPTKSESVLINGKMMYYEKHGKGTPLFLLHGYSLSSKSWLPYVKDFDKDYEVYLVDLNGHGKSDAFKNDLSLTSVAEDLNALIQYLNLNKIKAIGFSFGGDVLYQLALLNPSLIESMITIGAVGSWTVNDFPEYQKAFTFENKADFPWLEINHKTDFKIKALMKQFNNYVVKLSNEELQSIKPEVLIMTGDDDEGMNMDEVTRARKNLRNSDLWILPNVTHGAHEGENKEDFIKKSKVFLSKNQN